MDPVRASSITAVKQGAAPTVVPGLADANRYTFRDSCARPLRYLRHHVHALRLSSSRTPTPSAPTVPSP
ncbi:AbfB domain-containing protein [Streptomyces sp. 11x1]|nr:AbfB domain-containing protein [Streptomyces sp. 11x1]